MTNTLNKIMHDGDEYLLPEGFSPDNAGTTDDVLTKTANGYEWSAPSGGDVVVSSQTGNILQSGMAIWCGEETDYANLGSYSNNTLYLTIPDQSGPTPPSPGWQPGANTVAYYPLDTDFTDGSGNGYNLTNNGGVITTLNGVSCAYYDGSSHSATSTPTFTGTRTLSCWWNPASTSGVMGIIVTGYEFSNNEKRGIQQNRGVLWGSEWKTTNQSVNSNITITARTWYYVVTTIENGTEAKIYVNGVLANTLTRNNAIQNSYGLAVGSNFSKEFSEPAIGYISNAIIEDKARTAQEISDYYNQTKGDYGIS